MLNKKRIYLTYLLLGILLVGMAAVAFITYKPEKPNEIPSAPRNDKYTVLVPTHQEPEYKISPHLPISSTGNDYNTATPGHLPAGSAILTDTLDGSGQGTSQLNSKGITHIIHACPKPRSSFANDQDFINCVVKAVQNSIILADRNNFEKLAIPFVGGGTYLGNCDPQKLAEGIMMGIINQLENCKNLKRISLIDWGGDSNNYLLKAFESEFQDKEELFGGAVSRDNKVFGKLKSNPEKLLGWNKGDIRDKNIHSVNIIVNAANTYVGFGSGISGAIAQQVGNKTKIEAKTKEWIKLFNSQIK